MRVAELMFLCILFVACSYGQTIKGTVKDSSGRAVPYATVSLKNSAGNTILAYTVTDSKGRFCIAGTCECHCKRPDGRGTTGIGYKTAVKSIASFDAPIDFTLATESNPFAGSGN